MNPTYATPTLNFFVSEEVNTSGGDMDSMVN